MTLTFVQLAGFVRDFTRAGLTDGDLQALESAVDANPAAGKVIVGTGGLRKLRFAPPSRNVGKSGAFRVTYLYFKTADAVYFIQMFAKNEKANLTAAEKAAARAIAAEIDAGVKAVAARRLGRR